MIRYFFTKHYLLILLFAFNPGVLKIFSQGADSIERVINQKQEIKNDSDLIINKDVGQKDILNMISFLNVLPDRGIIIGYCDGIKIWKTSNGKKDTIIRIGNEEVVKNLLITSDEKKMILSVICNNEREDFISCYSLVNFKLLWRTTLVNFENGLGLFEGDSTMVAVGSSDVTLLNIYTGKVKEQK
jgi:hypothetical protein